MIRLKTKLNIEMRKLVLVMVFACGAILSQAQNAPTKIGYADVDYILNEMPETKQIEADLKSTQAQLKNQIDGKYAEFQKKYQDYNANVNTMLEAVRANTERELQQLQQNLEKLQQDAQTTIQNKQLTLTKPLYERIGKAIEAVAKENNYAMVLTAQVGGLDVVLYADDSTVVSDLVLKKLGVTPKPAGTTTTPQPK
jgi:outer membrane protein